MTEEIDDNVLTQAYKYWHDTGFDEGFEEGYDLGYNDGWNAASSANDAEDKEVK